MKTQAFATSVDYNWIAALYPVRGAVVVGVGGDNLPWMTAIGESECEQVLLLDADSTALDRTNLIAVNNPGWQLKRQVVSRHAGQLPFYSVANRSESCLIHPDAMRDLWPNIRLNEEKISNARSLTELLQESGVVPNWLVVDCLPGVELIADVPLEELDVVILRMVMDEQCPQQLTVCTATQTDDFMQKNGFICLNHSAERHPKLGHGLYVRDYATAINDYRNQAVLLKNDNSSLREENAALKRNFDAAAPSLVKLEKRLSQNKDASTLLMSTAQQVADKEKKIQHQEENQSIQKVAQSVVQPGGYGVSEYRGYSYLETQLLMIVTGLSEQLSKVHHTMNQGAQQQTEQILQQLESHMGIQYYLKEGKFLPDMHVWPISPDIALWMMELVATRDYDLILEFGSGTSTLLMAQTLLNATRSGELKRAAIQVAFEHSPMYHAKTAKLLEQADVRKRVDLMLTLLEPYTAPKDDASKYSYYSCGEKMASLAHQFGSSQHPIKIFMLVDGPPGSTNKHARYPALAHVLKAFPNAQIDLVLDDYQRDEEKEIAKMWLTDLSELGRKFRKTNRKMEKDACIIEIQPLQSDEE